ncbi:DUF4198 domain-containing protein [Desulfovibrio inopinatus]|uniref:DUF4198 domain-containing protein n=1 Tax=Desulfovibrio inopinatus TaxID=102109 RepID=UPI0003F7CC87|nr:DUF4198 domain-containing protein [Desulfovibrio inopinatus]
MARTIATAFVLCLTLGVSSAFAHDFWVNAETAKDQVIKVDIGYGHDFPNPESIPEKRVHLFEAPTFVTPAGEVALKQSGENYAYQGMFDAKPGSYLALGTYRPTFWSKGPRGWAMEDRTQMKDAELCEHVSMYAKNILNVGDSSENTFIGKPVGQGLEIIPLVNPATVKPGGKFPIQILVNGKPAKTVEVTATFGGFSDKESKAFYGHTGLDGKIDIIPLKAGYWMVEAEYKEKYKDESVCDDTYLLSTLTFSISEK